MREQFNREVEQIRPRLVLAAWRYLGNREDAEDVVQDALVLAWKKLHTFRGESQLSTWLHVIVRNCIHMTRRKMLARGGVHLGLDNLVGDDARLVDTLRDSRPSPEESFHARQMQRYFERAVERLTPALRVAYQLRDIEGVTEKESAQILRIPVGTLKARTSRARQRMGQVLYGVRA